MNTRIASVLAGLSMTAAVALAAPVSATLTAGSVSGAGFPEPLIQQNKVSTTIKRSGGGSTGGGFGGTASAFLEVGNSGGATNVALTGSAAHTNEFGYTAAYTDAAVVLTLTEAATYTITNLSTTQVNSVSTAFNPVTFESANGFINAFTATRGELSPGTYRLRFGVAAAQPFTFSFSLVATWYNQFNATGCANTNVNWTITLRKPCHGDINFDTLVDDLDFQSFAVAYDILGCAQPGMPQGCPADFNNDGVVDDFDFQMFVVSYNELVCP
ncbi:MAG TPA: hypothetical protein VF777_06405 [Phycisphaerales bacterium]